LSTTGSYNSKRPSLPLYPPSLPDLAHLESALSALISRASSRRKA
jgi:hypothetical protein